MLIHKPLALLLLFLASMPLLASTPVPAPPAIKASGYMLLDHASNTVLLEKNADTPLEPASLTKIMTAYIAFDELKKGRLSLEDETIVSEKAWKTGGSRMFIEVNKPVSIDDLLHGLVIQSGNDAAVALAEHIAGSEEAFAELMNQQAKQLGMQNSAFKNSTGWPAEGHVTTARDIAILARAMIKNFPDMYPLHAVKSFKYNNIQQYNRNKLLWRDKTVDGIKTGHTEAAGYCLVASAVRDEMRLISVVLGTSSENARASASAKLLNFGFRFYESRELYKAGEKLTSARIWKGDKQHVDLGVASPINVTIPRGDYKLLKAELAFPQKLVAPVAKGEEIGKAIVQLEGKTITSLPLVALEDISEGSLWTRTIDNFLLLIE